MTVIGEKNGRYVDKNAGRGWIGKVREINHKYREPRLQMTPMVKASLLALRIYLIVLVLILCYKFYLVVR
ncbi:MAG: hypothetical protein PHQ34_08310 [Methanothrix sp.]|nr:hypothetical protein [Methanothrix sp.]